MAQRRDVKRSYTTFKKKETNVKIEILGTGCPKCTQLAENAKIAAESLKIEFELEKVQDVNDIITYGVMMTPALVIDGIVKVVGKVPTVDEVKKLLT